MNKKIQRGFIDPLSLIGVVFLVVTLITATAVTTNTNVKQMFEGKATVDDCTANGGCMTSTKPCCSGYSVSDYGCTQFQAKCQAKPAPPAPTPIKTPVPPAPSCTKDGNCTDAPEDCCSGKSHVDSVKCDPSKGLVVCGAKAATPKPPTPTKTPVSTPNPTPTYTCTLTSGQYCIPGGCLTEEGFCSGSGTCRSGSSCCKTVCSSTPTPTPVSRCFCEDTICSKNCSVKTSGNTPCSMDACTGESTVCENGWIDGESRCISTTRIQICSGGALIERDCALGYGCIMGDTGCKLKPTAAPSCKQTGCLAPGEDCCDDSYTYTDTMCQPTETRCGIKPTPIPTPPPLPVGVYQSTTCLGKCSTNETCVSLGAYGLYSCKKTDSIAYTVGQTRCIGDVQETWIGTGWEKLACENGCKDNSCVLKALGEICSSDNECESGYCYDSSTMTIRDPGIVSFSLAQCQPYSFETHVTTTEQVNDVVGLVGISGFLGIAGPAFGATTIWNIANTADDLATTAQCLAGDQFACSMTIPAYLNPIPGMSLVDDLVDLRKTIDNLLPSQPQLSKVYDLATEQGYPVHLFNDSDIGQLIGTGASAKVYETTIKNSLGEEMSVALKLYRDVEDLAYDPIDILKIEYANTLKANEILGNLSVKPQGLAITPSGQIGFITDLIPNGGINPNTLQTVSDLTQAQKLLDEAGYGIRDLELLTTPTGGLKLIDFWGLTPLNSPDAKYVDNLIKSAEYILKNLQP